MGISLPSPALTSGWVLLAVVLVGLLLIYPALILRKYIRIMMNILDDLAPNHENGSDASRPAGEEVTFRAADGHRLEGVILSGDQARERPAGMIVFAHEFGSDRSSCARYCRGLLEAGYDVFAFDFRNHGGSQPEEGYRPRQWPSDRERADMLGAMASIGSYLELHDRPREIGVFGVSRGGGAAILAAAGIEDVRAIVTDGAFSETTLEYFMRRFANAFARIRVVAENHPPMVWRFLRWMLFRECARRSGCRFPSVRKAMVRVGRTPIFLIHGEKDSYIPVAQSQDLFDLARGPKSLWIVPGATHNQSVMMLPVLYGRRLAAFFDEHLAAAPRPARSAVAQAHRDEVLATVTTSSFIPDLTAARREASRSSA